MLAKNHLRFVWLFVITLAMAMSFAACKKKDAGKAACKKFCNRLPEQMPKGNIEMFFNGINGCINHCKESSAKQEVAKKCAEASDVVECYSKETKGKPLWYKPW